MNAQQNHAANPFHNIQKPVRVDEHGDARDARGEKVEITLFGIQLTGNNAALLANDAELIEFSGDALLFRNEVQAAFKSTTEVAKHFGRFTVGDVTMLSMAIHDGTHHYYLAHSRIMELVEALPSAEKWKPFLKKALQG